MPLDGDKELMEVHTLGMNLRYAQGPGVYYVLQVYLGGIGPYILISVKTSRSASGMTPFTNFYASFHNGTDVS